MESNNPVFFIPVKLEDGSSGFKLYPWDALIAKDIIRFHKEKELSREYLENNCE